jgi:AcrR family transcriptional regulator
MSRPVSIRNDVILDAARQAFLAHGYLASTVEIARRAGVSEGLIFKRFKTKMNLFAASLDTQRREREWQQQLMAGVGRANIRATLEAYGRHLLKRLRIVMPRILMISSRGPCLLKNCFSARRCPPPQMQHVTILARYLRAEAHGGRLRLERPEIHADAFVGALSHYVFWETVLGHRIASHNVYIRMLVSNMLRAALQPAGAIAQSKRRTDRNSTVEGQASGPLQ